MATATAARVFRIDNGNGEETELTTKEQLAGAVRIIKDHYGDSEAVMESFRNGHPVRCTFATYVTRSF